ncbi:unnamed protein product [Staurois parvus]|uniref:Uncharacterized protein n=1 Tax=Staurois parvus TaxID=386267 RepID=A0ABN9ES99_9NEOB|nr:unnamed protein product [Staurois parvus]
MLIVQSSRSHFAHAQFSVDIVNAGPGRPDIVSAGSGGPDIVNSGPGRPDIVSAGCGETRYSECRVRGDQI